MADAHMWDPDNDWSQETERRVALAPGTTDVLARMAKVDSRRYRVISRRFSIETEERTDVPRLNVSIEAESGRAQLADVVAIIRQMHPDTNFVIGVPAKLVLVRDHIVLWESRDEMLAARWASELQEAREAGGFT